MPPGSSSSTTSPRRSRQVKRQRQSRADLGDVAEAFRRYFDKVERDAIGNVVATCTRCRVVLVVAWPDDLGYVRGLLNQAHQKHNHRG
jgi:hypothetical protein